ncbi:linear amide C-N hydrolase [Ruegeria arenilitoris]|uniref:linear amide C-N hydrolase n=1 Tax=Ruegeria arenilitoris TaxID=1173585 RepID=UPI00147A78CB|nr:choloylglycine hydrolase family protein [Ruegeria arenilitoris]
MKTITKQIFGLSIAAQMTLATAFSAEACTGIQLNAQDGSSVYGRTMEWGAFDLHSRVAIIPRNFEFTGKTPEGQNGKVWRTKYGVVALDMLGQDYLADGMNEAGLAGGLFYHPGFADYAEYDPDAAADTITAVDVLGYALTQFSSLEELREGLQNVRVVPVVEEAIGIPVAAHWIFNDRQGNSMVVEAHEGELRFFDAPLGVITNAPNYDWHTTNLRNYLNLSAVALPDKRLENTDFTPLGAGSGMIGLPGDHTPPSRFIRAVAWSQTARPTSNSDETVYELFRILDNFNLPLGSAEGSDLPTDEIEQMRSATIWTTVWDQQNMTLYFHTQHNRRVRMLGLEGLDFSSDTIRHLPLDLSKSQDVEDLATRE